MVGRGSILLVFVLVASCTQRPSAGAHGYLNSAVFVCQYAGDLCQAITFRMSGQPDLVDEMVRNGQCGWFPKGTRFTLMKSLITEGFSVVRYPVVAFTWEEGTHNYVTDLDGMHVIAKSAQ